MFWKKIERRFALEREQIGLLFVSSLGKNKALYHSCINCFSVFYRLPSVGDGEVQLPATRPLPEHRKIIEDIASAPDKVVSGTFSGQAGAVNFLIKGNDVVVEGGGPLSRMKKDK